MKSLFTIPLLAALGGVLLLPVRQAFADPEYVVGLGEMELRFWLKFLLYIHVLRYRVRFPAEEKFSRYNLLTGTTIECAGKADITGPVADINLMVRTIISCLNSCYV